MYHALGMGNTLTIQEAAQEVRLSAHTLRYYERAGLLLHVPRTEGGARRYTQDSIELLKLLVKLRATGMPIRLLKQYVGYIRAGDETMPKRKELLQEHRNDVASKVAELQLCLQIIDLKLELYESGMTMRDNHPCVQKLTTLLN